jgi:hypothetical protein
VEPGGGGMNAITDLIEGTNLNVYSATSSASRRTSRPRSEVALPPKIEQWVPSPQNVNISLAVTSFPVSTSIPVFVLAAFRIAIALIAMFDVPLVTVGLLETTATSCAPVLSRWYDCDTWSAIWLDILATVPGVGFQADHAAGGL